MDKKFEVHQTKIKGSCQSGRKAAEMISNSEMFLKQMNIILELTNVSLSPQVIVKFNSSAANSDIPSQIRGKNMMQLLL